MAQRLSNVEEHFLRAFFENALRRLKILLHSVFKKVVISPSPKEKKNQEKNDNENKVLIITNNYKIHFLNVKSTCVYKLII